MYYISSFVIVFLSHGQTSSFVFSMSKIWYYSHNHFLNSIMESSQKSRNVSKNLKILFLCVIIQRSSSDVTYRDYLLIYSFQGNKEKVYFRASKKVLFLVVRPLPPTLLVAETIKKYFFL